MDSSSNSEMWNHSVIFIKNRFHKGRGRNKRSICGEETRVNDLAMGWFLHPNKSLIYHPLPAVISTPQGYVFNYYLQRRVLNQRSCK